MNNFNLVLIDQNIDRLQTVRREFVSNSNREVFLLHKDLSKSNVAQEIYEEVKTLGIRIDALINNAGYGIFGFFNKIDWDHQKNLIQLTVLTTTHLTKLFLKDMIHRNCGKSILCVLSRGVIVGDLL